MSSTLGSILSSTEVPGLATDNLFSGKIEIKNPMFSQPFDADLFIAGTQRVDPADLTQGIYVMHRVMGDMGSQVQDGAAFELKLNNISNATFLNACELSLVVTGGASTIPDTRGLTVNFRTDGTPSGAITNLALIRTQTVGALGGTTTVANLVGLWVEQQTVGADNWSVFAPGTSSKSRFEGQLFAGGASTPGQFATFVQAAIKPTATSRTALTLQGASGQTAALFRITAHSPTDALLAQFTATGALDMAEQSDPAAPAANVARLFSRDNGSGKTQVCVRFPTGAVQVLATEP